MGSEIHDLGIFLLEFRRTIAIIEISTLKFVNFPNFAKKTKKTKKQLYLNLCLKMRYLDIFWAIISKTYCHTWNQHPESCLTSKLSKNIKLSKFRTENALFGYFLAGIWKKRYCHIWNQRLWICLAAKLDAKLKILKLLEFENNIVVF